MYIVIKQSTYININGNFENLRATMAEFSQGTKARSQVWLVRVLRTFSKYYVTYPTRDNKN